MPFIDVKLLKDTIAAHCPESKLSPAEKRRNSAGKVYCYRYDVTCTDTVDSPNRKIGLPDIVGSHSSVVIIEEQETQGIAFQPRLLPGTRIPYPGFPSLNVLPFASVELVRIGLNVFGTPSKYPTTVLSLCKMPELPPLEVLAETVLGKSLYVNWPMMHEAQVVAISNEKEEIRLTKAKRVTKKFKDVDVERWHSESEAMMQMYHIGNGVPGSGGVVIGDVKIRLRLLPLQGMKTNSSNGSTKKLFGREEADVPLQLALWEAPAPDPRFTERGPMTLADRFPEGCDVVLTKGKYRGCRGRVIGIADPKSVGVKVEILPPELPFGLAIARSVQETYLSSVDAARILKMNPGLFGKLTGKLQFDQGKYDLGLNLKSADGSCVVGYTRRKIEKQHAGPNGKSAKPSVWEAGDSVLVIGSARTANRSDEDSDERIQWEYSPKAIRLVETYRQKFPQLFAEIKKNPNERKYDARKVFGPNGEAWLPLIREWLDQHESAKLPRSPVTSESMSYDAVAAVQKAADVRSLALKKRGYPKESLIKIPGNALYREGSTGATDVLLASDLNSNEAPELGDRIVNLCADGVPFGARGTVVGIHEAVTTGSVEVVMDEEFIGGTSLQGSCSNFRGKLCLWSHLLKIAPENSKALVDKLVPKGSSRANVEKIISNIEHQVRTDNTGPLQSSWDATVDKEAPLSREVTPTGRPGKVISTPGTAPTVTAIQDPADHTAASAPRNPSTGRTGSAARGRQGTWREAKGPDKKGTGFINTQHSKTGLSLWKAHVKKLQEPVPSLTSEAELKALLGVPATSVVPAASQTATDGAAADLKALLGVGSIMQPVSEPLQVSSAADKLLQLMSSKQPNPQMYPNPASVRSTFNFTYVEEGKEPKPGEPPHFQAPAAHFFQGFHAGAMPHPAAPPLPHLGFPGTAPMVGSPYGQWAPPGPPAPPNQPMPLIPRRGTAQAPQDAAPSPNEPTALSLEQFPPLGMKSAAPAKKPATPIAVPKPESTMMVPSVVAGTTRR